MRVSSAKISVWMRVSSGDNSTLALALVVLPLGRPPLRLGLEGALVLALALACAAVRSSGLRTTCSRARGNERRCLVLISDKVKKARPGMGLPARLAKK